MTAVFDAQDAIHEMVRGLDSIGGWKVDLGFPQGANVQNKHVWVNGETDDAAQVWGLSDLTAKDETFQVRVHVVATAKAKDYATPRDKVKAVTAELASALNDDYTLGGVVMQAAVTNTRVDDAQPDESTRQVMHTLTITCQAWLT
jgi:hypothetical protein